VRGGGHGSPQMPAFERVGRPSARQASRAEDVEADRRGADFRSLGVDFAAECVPGRLDRFHNEGSAKTSEVPLTSARQA